ncbi:hypothetical protein [Alkalihalobacillus trypoxylicola]|uniref:Uncharacterized protein n=1 Tax=Alkalihalobacillus trypoxylicola TaxID=519424 RepID=A0A161P9G1_9BACI|nr:hypothetical protein [Alkalihalobacillus trypoxylicola]KYG28174.1 hypothetical protein AZF04_09740 [Alkalihalobacillus trypoxylicola]
MAYLTYEQYKEMGFVELEQDEFNSLLPRASDEIDNVTRLFYHYHDIESDHPIRRNMFRKAIGAQIDYFHELGSTTTEGINTPVSVTIGRTSQSEGAYATNKSKNIVSSDALRYLYNVGLVNRVIGVRG